MNYIVFDLEWNQCPDGKEKENKDLPFEIVEFGAVKLGPDRKVIDEFQQFVSPEVYRELHYITRDLVKISMRDLDEGLKFPEAAKAFFDWCAEGGEYMFGTWGSTDLMELQRNCRFFNVDYEFPKPLLYYDIQKLYSICYSDGKSRAALETAIDELQLEKDAPFHAAIYDAIYTAQVFEKLDFAKVQAFTSIDTFWIPACKEEEFEIVYPTYSKFISRAFDNKDHVMSDPGVIATRCYLCGRVVKKKIRWFSANQKQYYCLGICEEHGYIKGRIKIKKIDDDNFFAVKVIKVTDEEGAKEIKQRQYMAREKRRERRHREQEKNSANNELETVK